MGSGKPQPGFSRSQSARLAGAPDCFWSSWRLRHEQGCRNPYGRGKMGGGPTVRKGAGVSFRCNRSAQNDRRAFDSGTAAPVSQEAAS